MSATRRKSSSNPRAQRIESKRKIAFVCSGGASKAGAFHLGVALALKEQGFKFTGGLIPRNGEVKPPGPMEISQYVGSSAGSIICSYLAAGYSLDNIFNSFLGRTPPEPIDPADLVPKVLPRLTYQKMFKLRPSLAREQIFRLAEIRKAVAALMEGDFNALFQLKWLKATGLFSTGGIEAYMRDEVMPSDRFEDYMADLFIVATQLNHSRKVVFGKYAYQPPPSDLNCQYNNDVPISRACAASTSLPIIYTPYPIKNENDRTIYYIDGEIRDTLSTHVAVDGGADLVIASYTHQPYHFLREIGSLTDYGLPAIAVQTIFLVIEQKINNHIHNKQIQKNAITEVSKYCKDAGLLEEHRRRILEILERELNHRPNVDTIYIHPSPTDAQMFFGEHFSLSSKRMADIVRSGFKAAIEALRNYDFADRETGPAIGVSGAPSGT